MRSRGHRQRTHKLVVARLNSRYHARGRRDPRRLRRIQLDRLHLLTLVVEQMSHHLAAENVDFCLAVPLGHHAKFRSQVDHIQPSRRNLETARSLRHHGRDPPLAQLGLPRRPNVKRGRTFEHDLCAIVERHFHEAGRQRKPLAGVKRRRRNPHSSDDDCQRELRVAVILATGAALALPTDAIDPAELTCQPRLRRLVRDPTAHRRHAEQGRGKCYPRTANGRTYLCNAEAATTSRSSFASADSPSTCDRVA